MFVLALFLFMKRPAPNTPKVISNTPNRNKFSPKEKFVTPRVFCNNPSLFLTFIYKLFASFIYFI